MPQKFQKMFSVFEAIAFQPIAGISLIYDEDTCDRQPTCYQTVPRFGIWLKDMFSNSICPILIENCNKTAGV